MSCRFACGTCLSGLLLLLASAATGSTGDEDAGNSYPAVGVYFVAATYPGEPLIAEGYCSGTLIAPDVFMTAAHCTFYDSRRFVEEPSYESADAWVSFDPIALDHDFWCYLQDIDYPGADDLDCDPDARTQPEPSFHPAHSTGITHPDYPRIRQRSNGTWSIHEPIGPHNPDLAVLILETPIAGITPLSTAPLGFLDELDPPRPPVVGVGYGLNYLKSTPAQPEQPGGEGPTTFEGPFGVRRIADLGTIRTLTSARVTPTQDAAHGEDTVCYGDSGSPLFVVQDGAVDLRVVGVLTGAALWCQGSNDPYARVDIATSIDFLDCIDVAGSFQEACACGAESALDLCPAP